MMNRFTTAGRAALDQNNHYGALTLALMMPDICGSLENPGPGKSKQRYENWFRQWAQPKFTFNSRVYLSAEDCYQLRCSLIHSGSAEVDQRQVRVLEQFLFFDDTCSAHLNWVEGNIVNGQRLPNFLQLNTRSFCETLFQCAEEWDAAKAGDAAIQAQKTTLITIKSAGYAVGGGAIRFG